MASLRKRYQNRIEVSSDKDAPAVASMPQETAAQPPPVADKQSAEPLEPEKDAVREAALKARLREMDRAEALRAEAVSAAQQRMATEPPPTGVCGRPLTVEEIIANTTLPDRAKDWLRRHPDYATDPVKTNRLLVLDEVATRQAGDQFSDRYFHEMEILLGLKQQPPSRAEILASIERLPETTTATPPHNAAPLRQ